MVRFCADDYGISKSSNNRIEECLKNGALNKISVLPNGDIDDFKKRLSINDVKLSLHLNLIEGYPLSKREDVSLLVSKRGNFRYSFIGLFFLCVFGNRKKLKKQLYTEIKTQIDFWINHFPLDTPISIDSHQHTHMIPLVFKTLMKVIKDDSVKVEYLRIPAEPLIPYIKCLGLYLSISPVGIIKQWLLKFLNLFNKKELKKANINTASFMGILFSGKLSDDKVKKMLPQYEKTGKNIEIAFHPGYLENDEPLIDGCKSGFKKFYYSKWRKKEYEALLKLKVITKEGI